MKCSSEIFRARSARQAVRRLERQKNILARPLVNERHGAGHSPATPPRKMDPIIGRLRMLVRVE